MVNVMKYPLSSRILHWLMAALVLFMIGLGFYMTEILPKDAPNHLQVYNLHKAIGVVILLLVMVRIANRLIKKAPPLQESISKIERILSHLAHFGLYVLMISVPLSGYLMSSYFGFPVHLFNFEMPIFVERNFEYGAFFKLSHELSAYALIGLVSVHILAVIKHRYFDKAENDVLKRML
jgi:cytochrome b561